MTTFSSTALDAMFAAFSFLSSSSSFAYTCLLSTRNWRYSARPGCHVCTGACSGFFSAALPSAATSAAKKKLRAEGKSVPKPELVRGPGGSYGT